MTAGQQFAVTARASAAPPLAARVFAQLADGRFHSGETLAGELGVSRGAVWKAVRLLRASGMDVYAVPNRGYRMPAAAEPLDAARISAYLSGATRTAVRRLEVLWSVDSTNSMLLARPNPPLGNSEALLAEYQTAGRGRRGRAWIAPPGAAICLSQSWTFREVPADLGALGLAIGVCVLRALRRSGLEASLKWPNDVLLGDRKLGGILLELRAESTGPASVVVGIGLNATLSASARERIAALGLPATDLLSAGIERSRNRVAAHLIDEVVAGLGRFEREALRPFVEEWRTADALRGRQLEVRTAAGTTRGLACGIDLHGALLVETPQGVQRFISGEVTVRPVS